MQPLATKLGPKGLLPVIWGPPGSKLWFFGVSLPVGGQTGTFKMKKPTSNGRRAAGQLDRVPGRGSLPKVMLGDPGEVQIAPGFLR